ncbi:hypothetical protein [Clostridium sp. ZBS2]|uniref:hypothetical protein n=1 Tax=Clostridium sp. ZBS2 TaxID=2949976 RepID=UPI0013F9D546|nr:hypothetical protein [Clostridium sp. ZBS2]NFR85748.1 hypothetical protein [Clostridium botulinum]NFR88677.1 hypothetical protein [Clostridium botulinum]
MKDNITEELINFTINSYCQENDSIFLGSLMVLKKYADFEYVEGNSILKLINIIPVVKDITTRASLIEIIVEVLCYHYDNNEELLYDNNEELLDEYVHLLSQNATSIEDAKNCLIAFIILGVNKDKLFNKIVKKLNKKQAVQIFMNISDEWEIVPKEAKEMYTEVELAKKISYRSSVVSTFLLIVHPLCSKYEYINCISFSCSSLLAAIADWGWKTSGSTNYLVERKIITKKEGKILEHLGALLMSDIEWDSEEIKKLYYEFFNNKDPLNVMFTLPE